MLKLDTSPNNGADILLLSCGKSL